MNSKYIIWGLGALAVVGVGYYLMYMMKPKTAKEATNAPVSPSATDTRVFGLGDSDEDITVIQRLMGIEETGVFDEATQNKVFSVFGKKTVSLAEVSARRAEFLPKG